MKRTGIIAEKLGMSSLFTEDGRALPVTLLKVDSLQVIAQRTQDKDGYTALVLGAKNTKPTKINKAQRTVFAKSKIEPKTYVKEFRITEDGLLDVGLELKASHFRAGQIVDIAGTSIGKGFAGAMKRHNFRGLEATHGVSVSHRSHGSTGGCQDPGRVFKNKKMAGHLGHERVTKQNLEILDVNEEDNIIFVKGSVPGPKGGVVYVTDSVKKGN
jgi:large subunit ribosomal protein L3